MRRVYYENSKILAPAADGGGLDMGSMRSVSEEEEGNPGPRNGL